MNKKVTPAPAHYRIIREALEHGKHVYTEKTLTDDIDRSGELVRLAREKGLYLACPGKGAVSRFGAGYISRLGTSDGQVRH